MPSALESLRASKTFDVTLGSGLEVTLCLPRLRDVVAAGDVPMSIVAKLEAQGRPTDDGDVAAMTPEEMRYVFRFNDEIVRMSVIAIHGEPLELSLDDVKLLDESDCAEIVSYALREKAIGGKAS
jgi:hypothetical protein